MSALAGLNPNNPTSLTSTYATKTHHFTLVKRTESYSEHLVLRLSHIPQGQRLSNYTPQKPNSPKSRRDLLADKREIYQRWDPIYKEAITEARNARRSNDRWAAKVSAEERKRKGEQQSSPKKGEVNVNEVWPGRRESARMMKEMEGRKADRRTLALAAMQRKWENNRARREAAEHMGKGVDKERGKPDREKLAQAAERRRKTGGR